MSSVISLIISFPCSLCSGFLELIFIRDWIWGIDPLIKLSFYSSCLYLKFFFIHSLRVFPQSSYWVILNFCYHVSHVQKLLTMSFIFYTALFSFMDRKMSLISWMILSCSCSMIFCVLSEFFFFFLLALYLASQIGDFLKYLVILSFFM